MEPCMFSMLQFQRMQISHNKTLDTMYIHLAQTTQGAMMKHLEWVIRQGTPEEVP
jgi:hypothetical protein